MHSVVSTLSVTSATRLSRPILISGFFLGLFLSYFVLIGDNAGRVNLLYLLLVYLFVPLFGAALSVISLLTRKGINVARLLTAIPLWPKAQDAFSRKLRQSELDKQWFFLQSQGAALAYAFASLLTFFLLLLTTDINFVWRSTLLNAESLQPLLKLIALPWWFWEDAQPTLELLRLTQDSRLNDNYAATANFGQWWAFVLATQVVYAFLLRGVLLALAKLWIRQRTMNNQRENVTSHKQEPQQQAQSPNLLCEISHSLPSHYLLGNWAQFDDSIMAQLSLNTAHRINVGPLATKTDSSNDLTQRVLLVKAWEPPLGELQDYMQTTTGLLYPVNIKNNSIVPAAANHIEEWQRFTKQLPAWGIYQPSSQGAKDGE